MPLSVAQLEEQLQQHQLAPVYLIQGQDHYLLQQVRQAFLSLIDPADRTLNFAQYDMREVPLATALDDARNVPFFGAYRLVMIDDAYFLTGEAQHSKPNHDLSQLLEYLSHPEPQTILVLFAPYEKLDSRKKVTKQLKERAVYVPFGKLTERDLRQFVQERLDKQGYNMSMEAQTALLNLTNFSLTQIMAELTKLMLYAEQSHTIDLQTVRDLVTKTLSQNVFDLIDQLLKQHLRQAVELYHELLINGEEPLRIQAAILSQFRLLVQVKASTLSEQGLAKALKVHPYRIKLAKQTVRRYRYATLGRAYLGLIRLEEQLKSTQRDPELLFELFVLRYQATVRE